MSEGTAPKEHFAGVFSLQKTIKIGAGATSRRVAQSSFFFVSENEEGQLIMQALGPLGLPVGTKTPITREDLLKSYLPEPGMYQQTVLPKMREVQVSVARGEKFRKRGETFTAEFEFNKALALDEENVRANFGIGLCYLSRGEKQKADEVFRRVVSIEAAYEPEHKHLFNEFGINLRRNGMYEQALDYYGRALDFAKDDEHLFFNIARTHIERRDLGRAREALEQALAINPDFAEARDYLAKLARGPAGLKLTPSS